MQNLISRKDLSEEISKHYDLRYGEILINPKEFYDMVNHQNPAKIEGLN